MKVVKYKWSNCLIESVTVFLMNPFNVSIHKKGSWKLIKKKSFPHFYWYCKRRNKYYHFCARYSDEPFLQQLWFQGTTEEYKHK